MPLEMQLFITRVPRNQSRIDDLEAEVQGFIGEVEKTLDQLKARYGGSPVEGYVNPLTAG